MAGSDVGVSVTGTGVLPLVGVVVLAKASCVLVAILITGFTCQTPAKMANSNANPRVKP
jgi:hypothetical protein